MSQGGGGMHREGQMQAARRPETSWRTADVAVGTADHQPRGNQGRATARRAVAGSQGPRQAPHPSLYLITTQDASS